MKKPGSIKLPSAKPSSVSPVAPPQTTSECLAKLSEIAVQLRELSKSLSRLAK